MNKWVIPWLNNVLIARVNDWVQKETVIRDIMQCIQRLRIDVLLICPQNTWIDVAVPPELVKRTGLPSVVWFMDDYWTDEFSRSRVREIWDNAQRRFTISEPMQKEYSNLYGGDCEVLNNSVSFPERYNEPAARSDPRLRMVYAGSMHSPYMETMVMVLEELHSLDGQVIFDIYSPDELPPEWRSNTDIPCRRLPPLAPGELLERLQEYDVLLLPGPFNPEYQGLAETSQSSKMADYLAAGRCMLVYGPEYSENVRYIQRHGIGEVVTSQTPGSLRASILSLARQPEHRRELGERAYRFGRERRDKATNSARLWQALSEAFNSPSSPRNRPIDKIRAWLWQALFQALNPK